MVRRSFRIGLRLGLLIGIGFALFKTFQSRRAVAPATPAGGDWEPMQPSTPAAEPVVRTPPRPEPAPVPVPESLRMPDVPEAPIVPPSAASEGHAATSTPPLPPSDLPVDEVGEPIELPAAPPPPDPEPEPVAAEVATPSETQLLDAGVRPAEDQPEPDPRDIDPAPAPVEAPVKKTAARKRSAAPRAKKAGPPPAEPVAKKAAPATTDDITPDDAAVKKAAKKAVKAAKAAKKTAAQTPPPAWVEPADGTCPPTHPVKAKLASKLFHLPGMFAYARTRPDRCYLDADTAVGDGFTQAKR